MTKACNACGCTGHKSRARASSCTDPATCWQWDHTCYAKRVAKLGKKVRESSAYAPATMAGRIVPNVRIAA